MKNKKIFTDPVIRVRDALNIYDGNQSKLAGALSISRASVNEWGDFVPVLQAYRLRDIHPDIFGTNSEHKEDAA